MTAVPESRGTAAVETELTQLVRTVRSFSTVLAEQVHPDLNAGEYLVLAAVADLERVRSTDLVPRLGLDKSTLSRQLAALRDLGLVETAVDETDARARLVSLTGEGRRRFERVRTARRERFRAYLRTWEQDDLDRLAALLHRLNADVLTPHATG